MDIDTEILEAFLNLAWLNAADQINSLPAQFQIEQQNALKFIATGSLSSVAKNSASQGYGGYSPGSLTQRQIVRVFSILNRDYNIVQQAIICAAQQANVDLTGFDVDPSVYSILCSFFQASAMQDRRPDITNLAIAVTLPGVLPWQPSEVAW